MRLWHTSLIPVLPREQLISQWRELSAIAGAIQKNGTPNHLLVNFIMDYDFDHFISYAKMVRDEMTKRGYRTAEYVWQKMVSLKPDYNLINPYHVYQAKMNWQYFLICYYNLYEKWTCGGISNEDARKIKAVYDFGRTDGNPTEENLKQTESQTFYLEW